MEIVFLPHEKWWGGIVRDGMVMPYTKNTIERDLSKDQMANQSSPLLLSNCGRYIWSEKPFQYTIQKNSITVHGIDSEIKLGTGHNDLKGSHKAVAKKFFSQSTKQLDPLMFLSPQFNTWIEMIYEPTQEKVLHYAKTILEQGFTPGVLIIDDNWQEDYGVWKFHQGRFPKPKKMIEELHAMGFKVMLWVCNFISPDSLTFRELVEQKLLVMNKNGTPAIANWWNGFSGMLDISNAKTLQWFNSTLEKLVTDCGVDGFKFDAGDLEHLEEEFVCSKPISATDYGEAWAKIGRDYELNEYRACWKMGGEALSQRLCDKNHSWSGSNALDSLIPDGLAQGLLGYYYSCPDMIGGGQYKNFLDNEHSLDQELIVRTAQCSALFPMMQFSVAPWRILNKENLQYCLEAAKIHIQLGEEIVKLAEHAAIHKEPIIRYMEYEFPHQGMDNIKDQFMLGEDILVAPVIVQHAVTRFVSFPSGIWIGDDGSKVTGPCTLEISAPLSRLPWYRKK